MTKKLAILIVGLALGALLASAAAAQEATPRIGVVDMEKIRDGFVEFKTTDEQFQAFVAERRKLFQDRAAVRLLNKDELKEYQNLIAVAAPSEQQKARLEELRKVAQQREDEVVALSRLPNPTEDEKKRLNELNAIGDGSSAEIEQLQKRLTEEIDARNKDLTDKLQKKIDAAMAAVAKEKRLDVILAKEAVLYGGRDVTPDILAKLNAPG